MANTTEINQVGALVRKAEQDFVSGVTLKSKYVEQSLYEDINKVEAYLNSTHTSGETDSMDRDKPFFNICLAARNIWFRATDLDRKNVDIQDKNPLTALIAKIYVQDWMTRNDFGTFLNSWGLNLAGYNETVVKFVEQNGQLYSMVVPWSRLICDSVDFANNIKIEILELTPSQLKQREGYDKKIVKELLDATEARQTSGKLRKDNKNEYIRLYEVHGVMPLSYLTGKEEDEDEYTQQMHVVSFVASKEKGKFDDFTLASGKESKDPYMLTALIPEVDGSIGLNGAVKNLFQAQWMENHSIKMIKDHLDLASKLIFQTSDPNFVGQNALSAIETGDIMVHAVNQPLTQLNNSSHDITSIQNFQNQWKVLGNELNGISEAMLGQNPPAGSAWRQTQALLNESHSLFELMTENKGLALERMLREYILPFIKKKLKNSKELVATLEANDIKKIDGLYIKNQVTQTLNNEIKKKLIEGKILTPEEQAQLQQSKTNEISDSLGQQGSVRTFKPSEVSEKTWDELFKDLEWDVKVNITGESANTNDMVATLTTVLQTIGTNPQALTNPAFAMVFNKILSMTGAISPVEINQTIQEAQNMQSEALGSVEAKDDLTVNKTTNAEIKS